MVIILINYLHFINEYTVLIIYKIIILLHPPNIPIFGKPINLTSNISTVLGGAYIKFIFNAKLKYSTYLA